MPRIVRCLPALLLASACASGGAATDASNEPPAIVVQNTQSITQTGGQNSMGSGSGMTSVVQAVTTRITVSAEKVFAALPSTL